MAIYPTAQAYLNFHTFRSPAHDSFRPCIRLSTIKGMSQTAQQPPAHPHHIFQSRRIAIRRITPECK
jgi:hypothetical protein